MSDSDRRLRTFYQDVSIQRNFAATDGNLTLITGRTNNTIYIQSITVTISTSAAQAITFEDSASPQVYVAKLPASPGVDTRWDFEFGDIGHALTSGKNLAMDMTAGNAGHVEVQGYMKLDNAIAAASV